jgi:hypothetical protein
MDDLENNIKLIKRLHRDRCFAMDVRKILDLKVGALLRIRLGWHKDKPEAERKRIAAQAQRLMNDPDSEDSAVLGTRQAREPIEAMEAAAEKAMGVLAKQLPAWEAFGKDVRGFGKVSLAVIVAEAGDLSNYASESKLWKRMGLAPGQNRVPPGLSREDHAKAWLANGYNPRRRSHMWNIGDTLIKAQVRVVKAADGKNTGERLALGLYGEIYLRQKANYLGRGLTKMHAHRCAQRYMEKCLLRHLRRAWWRTKPTLAERPGCTLSAISPIQDAA